MKISCKMAEDLLPLYLDETCSEDSRGALEGHLRTCEACRETLRRMRSPEPAPEPEEKKLEMLTYARKVKKHRLRSVLLFLCVLLVSTLVLTVVCLTYEDMMRIAYPYVPTIEDGVWNLTSGPLETKAEDAEQYILFTNYVKIEVTVTAEETFVGTVKLHNAKNPDDYIMIGSVTSEDNIITFSNLTAAERYIVSCKGLDGANVTITDGRVVNFWQSLENTVYALLNWLLEFPEYIRGWWYHRVLLGN